MIRYEPILFDPDQPLKHYEKAGKLKKEADHILSIGKTVSVLALAAGTACVIYNPEAMAMMALFGSVFFLLSFIGCWVKRPVMNLMSVPLGLAAAFAAAMSGSALAPLGAAAFLLASLWQIMNMNASANFCKLKDLPGFPFFDAAMDNISFAAMDRFGSDQFIDESTIRINESERIKLVPTEEPSDKMSELEAVSDEEKNILREPQLSEEASKNTMEWDNTPLRGGSEYSDVDLFS